MFMVVCCGDELGSLRTVVMVIAMVWKGDVTDSLSLSLVREASVGIL